jgi:ABC-type multidrug transport system ATPase subunit
MTIEGAVSSNAPALVVRTQGSDRRLQAGPAYKIGRDPASDIVVDDSRVSWNHAVLRLEHDCWLLEDHGSTNGTFMDSRRVHRVPITDACMLRLGHPEDGAAVLCSVAPAPAAPATGPMGTAIVATPSPAQRADWAAQGPPAPSPPVHSPPAPAEWAARTPPAPSPPAPSPAVASPPVQSPPVQRPPAHSPLGPPMPPADWGSPRAPAPGLPAQPAPASSIVRQPSAIMQLPTKTLRIGRASDNDVVVSDLGVSRYHAELRKTSHGYEIVDLASHNGTFVNGQWVTAAPVTERDIISIGPATFRLVGDELQAFIDTGDISLAARDLTVRLSSGKVLLDHVSFPLGERCLLGVIGPSGAGKSTLLGALTGTSPATEGNVLYDNRDLYTYYAELRHRIGLVPQDNILHTQLTARRALGYAAELRFPRDTSKAERKRRIDEVLQELSLTKHAETRTAAMSGGQQKRVNVALELLTKPSLLFLDEPTSGLDPGLDKSVMEMMADLAHDGRTIIVVTHSVANLNLCDRLLVLVPGGKVAYFGPPEDGLRYFGKPGWAEVFQAFDAEPNRDWAGEFRRSVPHERYVAAELSSPAPASAGAQAAAPPPATRNRFAQLSTLCRRYLAVIASSRVYLAMLAVTPIVLAGAVRLMPAPDGLAGAPGTNADAQGLLLILVMSACFTGAFLSVGEIVKERNIYARERAAGLSAGVYLWSKLLVLGFISAVQAILLVLLGLAGRPMPPTGAFLKSAPLLEILIATGFLALTSMALGLVFSSMSSTPEKTMPLLLVAVVVQIILSGGVFTVNGKVGAEQLAWLAPSRWGFAATAATANYNVIVPSAGVSAAGAPAAGPASLAASGKPGSAKVTLTAVTAPSTTAGASPKSATPKSATPQSGTPQPAKPDPLWAHTPRAWLTDIGGMVVLGIVFCLLTWRRLIRLNPGRG